jgi:hypothetical protein
MTGPNPLDAAKERLVEMRDEEIARMFRRGQLPQIAAINAVLAVLDEAPIEAKPASRAVVSDDGRETRLTLYAEEGAVASVVIDPIRGVTLAGELISAALPKLA